MKALSWLLLLAGLAIFSIGGYIIGSARHRVPIGGTNYLVGTVGNETLSSAELDVEMKSDIPTGVERLLRAKAIQLEARKLKIALPTKDFPAISPSDDPSGYRRSVQQAIKTQRLMRAILLHDIKEEELKAFYETFKDLLTSYELSVIFVASIQDAKFVTEDLKTTSFEKVYAIRAVDVGPGASGQLGFLNRSAILEKLGPQVWETISRMKPSTLSSPISTPRGLAVVRLGKVASSYDDLKPLVEDIFAQSQQKALLHRLREDYKMTINYKTFPFLDPRGPSPTPSASGTPGASPSPAATGSGTPSPTPTASGSPN